VLSGLIVSALKTALTVTRFGKRLVLREKSHGPEGVIAKTKIKIAMAGRSGDSSRLLEAVKPQVSWITCWSVAR
jgi:hypothetical protein